MSEASKIQSMQDAVKVLNILIVTEQATKTGAREDQINLLMDEFHNVESLIKAMLDVIANMSLQMAIAISAIKQTDMSHIEALQSFRNVIMARLEMEEK